MITPATVICWAQCDGHDPGPAVTGQARLEAYAAYVVGLTSHQFDNDDSRAQGMPTLAEVQALAQKIVDGAGG